MYRICLALCLGAAALVAPFPRAGLTAPAARPTAAPAPVPDGPPAPLKPEELPVTKLDGDLDVTLSELTPGLPPPPPPFVTEPGEETFTRMKLKVRWADRTPSVWRVDKVVVSDDAGHTLTPHHTSWGIGRDGEATLTFSGPTWPVNAPWKVRLELARTSPTPDYEFWKVFSPDELVTIPRVRVPERGETTPVKVAGEAQGTPVQILGLAGPHTRMPGSVPLDDAYPSVHFRYQSPQREAHVTFLRATDAAGTVIPRAGSAMGVGPEGIMYAYGLKVPSGVRDVYLAFAVHRNRVFEFTALPTVQ